MTDIQAFEAWAKDKQLEVFWSWEAWKAAIAHERSKAPAWQDAPTVPGLWLCNLDLQAYHLPDPEIDLGGGNSWFGPIPSEDK